MKTFSSLLFLPAAAMAQGPLAPPAAPVSPVGPLAALDGSSNPQPTMKTLHQVEPRIPVESLAASPPYTISQPGSYFLTANLSVASGDAIIVASSGVNLDLNGFNIRSTSAASSSGMAIAVNTGLTGITIRNGTIASLTTVTAGSTPVPKGFNHGIFAFSSQILVSDMQIRGPGGYGIYIQEGGIVERCTVAHCGTGIYAYEVRDSTVASAHLEAINAKTVSNCSGTSFTSTGIGSTTAMNSSGTSTPSLGIAAGQATNCIGISDSGRGLVGYFGAINSYGLSTSLYGVDSPVITNCVGISNGTTPGSIGLFSVGSATSSRGISNGGGTSYGIYVMSAISCTFTGLSGIPAGKAFDM